LLYAPARRFAPGGLNPLHITFDTKRTIFYIVIIMTRYNNKIIPIKNTFYFVLAFLVCCALTACSDAFGTDFGPSVQSDLSGGWLWEDAPTEVRRAYDISPNSIIGYSYNPGGSSFLFPFTPIVEWTRVKNPHFGQIGESYPEGFKLALRGGAYYVLYLHTNKQTMLQYESDDIGVANPQSYRIYAKRDLSNQDNGTPKSLKITGFHANNFQGGTRGAVVTVLDYLNREVANAATTSQGLAATMTFQLKRPNTNIDWTEAGTGYTIWLRVLADTYDGGEYRGIFFFIKSNVTFSGPEVVIPFSPEYWTFWDLDS
jgi:hypothetical protein